MPTRRKGSATDQAADPDKLVRQSAGAYRTADDRFEVRNDGGSWFLVDREQTNDFGQELIQGPFATLAAVRGAIPPARTTKVTPIRPPKTAGTAGAGNGKRAKKEKTPPPPPTWIDRLPPREATAVRRTIAAVERLGIDDAEDLVRRDREGLGPALATRLIERRLGAIVAELPERGRPGARELLARVAEVLTADGAGPDRDLPGWLLVEIGPEPEPANRRITIRDIPD